MKLASKTTLNLAAPSRTLPRAILGVVAVLLLAALVGKIMVADRLAQVTAARRVVDDLRAQIETLQAACADFDAVEEQYAAQRGALADPVAALTLVEREIFSACQVERLSLSEGRLDLTLDGLTLAAAADLLGRLRADDLVDAVCITNAKNGTAAMTVFLADGGGDPG